MSVCKNKIISLPRFIMKPSKKKNCQSKKSVNCSASTPKIDTYFKAAARQFNLNVEEKNASDEAAVRDIYIDALKKKLQDFTGEAQVIDEAENIGEPRSSSAESDDCCEKTVVEQAATDTTETLCDPGKQNGSDLRCKQCKEWEAKFNELQKYSLRLTIRNAEMDLKYEDLLKTKTGSNQLVPDSIDAAAPSHVFFTERELKFLECMSLEKTSDPTFVHHCIQYAYKDNPLVLVKKSLKGTAENVLISGNGDADEVIPGKYPMSPLKVETIRNLFIQRISKCQLGAVAYSERIKDTYLNRLIASGVRNVANKQEIASL